MEQNIDYDNIRTQQIEEMENRMRDGVYGFIYVTTNTINGKRYCGQRKFNTSSSDWRMYLGSGKLIKQALRKYGSENFVRNIIDYGTSKEDLDEKEKFWISFFDAVNDKNWYNIAVGGTTIGLCGELSPMAKLTNFDVENIINRYMNGEHSSSICNDYNISIDALRLIRRRKTWRNICCNDTLSEQNLNYTHIYMYSVDGNYLRDFNQIKQASSVIDVSVTNIVAVANHKQKTCGGYIWEYYKTDKLSEEELRFHSVERTVSSRSSMVYQYDSSHNLINTYNSIAEVCKFNNDFDYHKIVNACTGRRSNYIYGFYWEYDNDCTFNVPDGAIGVLMFDLNGNFEKKFDSIMQAAKEIGCSYETINNCCSGKTKTCKNHLFNYDNASEDFRYIGKMLSDSSRNKFSHRKCSVFQYSEKMKIEYVYESLASATRITGYRNIAQACNSNSLYKGFYWKCENKKITRKVSCFDEYGNYIKTYDKLSDVSNEGYCASSVSVAANNVGKKYSNKYWSYDNTDTPIENQENIIKNMIKKVS